MWAQVGTREQDGSLEHAVSTRRPDGSLSKVHHLFCGEDRGWVDSLRCHMVLNKYKVLK